MKNFFFKKSKEKTPNNQSLQNPFVIGMEGRKEWDDRYLNMRDQIKKWQLAFTLSMIATIVLAGILGKVTTQSHIKPVVVEVCNNTPQAILPVSENLPDEDRFIDFAIKQFIINSRTVIADAEAQKTLLNKVYAFSSDNTIIFLHDFYNKNNPFEIATHHTIQANIINTMKISPQTWQVTWDEIKKGLNGNETVEKSKWVATVTYRKGDVNPKFINDNPFGFYFSQMTWSEISGQQN